MSELRRLGRIEAAVREMIAAEAEQARTEGYQYSCPPEDIQRVTDAWTELHASLEVKPLLVESDDEQGNGVVKIAPTHPARCFECGATENEARLVLTDDDHYDCESEYDCAERCRANRDAER